MPVRSASTHTVRVPDEAHRMLHYLSEQSGDSMTTILARAVERYYREFTLQQANAAWAEILEDDTAREEIRQEQAELDGTLQDGLESEPW